MRAGRQARAHVCVRVCVYVICHVMSMCRQKWNERINAVCDGNDDQNPSESNTSQTRQLVARAGSNGKGVFVCACGIVGGKW